MHTNGRCGNEERVVCVSLSKFLKYRFYCLKNFHGNGISNRIPLYVKVQWPLGLLACVSPFTVQTRTTAFLCSEAFFVTIMYTTLAARCGCSTLTGSTGWLSSAVTEKWAQTKVGRKNRWEGKSHNVSVIHWLTCQYVYMPLCMGALFVVMYLLSASADCTTLWLPFRTIKFTLLYLNYTLKRLFCHLTAHNEKSQTCISTALTISRCWGHKEH